MSGTTVSILPYLLLATAYIALAAHAWREMTRPPDGKSSALAQRLLPQAAFAGALMLHAFLLAQSIWIEDAVNFNFANALSAVTWLTALLLWIGRLAQPLVSITALLLPVAALCALLPLWDAHPHWLRYIDQPWAALHIAVALIAFSVFIVAALQALLLMSVERPLHAGHALPFADTLPPLMTLAPFLLSLIAVAFVLLT